MTMSTTARSDEALPPLSVASPPTAGLVLYLLPLSVFGADAFLVHVDSAPDMLASRTAEGVLGRTPMAGSDTPTPTRDTLVDPGPLTLASTVEHRRQSG
jgi:hypothetical protein